MAGLLGGLYYALSKALKEEELKKLEDLLKEQKKPPTEKREEEVTTQPETIALEIGYGLIPYVDESQGGDVPERIKTIRRQLASEYGVVIPLVHIRDNLRLRPHQYRILIRGIEVDSMK